MPYVPRALAATLRRALRTFPAALVTGPRQTGKTTLLREEFGASHRYVSLERPDVRDAAHADPVGFLDDIGERIILDEIQYVSRLLHYIPTLGRDAPAAALASPCSGCGVPTASGRGLCESCQRFDAWPEPRDGFCQVCARPNGKRVDVPGGVYTVRIPDGRHTCERCAARLFDNREHLPVTPTVVH